jgi:type II secretory pathway pseudopilin PulG
MVYCTHKKTLVTIMSESQRGFTLLELLLVLGLSMSALLLGFYDKQADMEQAKARQVGGFLYQYGNAVRAILAENPNISLGVKDGTAWLKNSSCGGTLAVGKEYLPCGFPAASALDPIKFGQLAFSTLVEATGTSPYRKVTATTSVTPFTLSKRGILTPRSDLAGISALTAASAIMAGSNGGSGVASPTGALSQINYKANPLDATITITAGSTPANDVWLRTDGSNSMHAPLNFDSGLAGNREIQGVSRIQNLAAQVLTLGTVTGIAPVAGAGLVVDANAETIGNLRTRNMLVVDNGMVVTGNVSATGAIVLAQNMTAGINITAGQGVGATTTVTAGGNITAGGAALGQIFYDSNNTGYYADPHYVSNLNYVQSANINNTQNITSAGRVSTGEFFEIGGVATEGWGCSPNGLTGRAANGQLLTCDSGIWSTGGIQGANTFLGSFTGSVTLYSGPKPIIVQAAGGKATHCPDVWDGTNRYSLKAAVQGYTVARTQNNNSSWAKIATIEFGVPANTAFTISSYPWNCEPGSFNVTAFSL